MAGAMVNDAARTFGGKNRLNLTKEKNRIYFRSAIILFRCLSCKPTKL